MYLWLTYAQARQITSDARTRYPNEACGLIGGREGRPVEIVPIQNVAAQPQAAYQLAPEQQVNTLMRFQREGLDLLAIYHSHPETDPIPSKTDVLSAAYPDSVHLIVSLKGNRPRMAAWHIDKRVTPVPLYIRQSPPDVPPMDTTPSTAQKYAILLTTLVAVLAAVSYSIYLLPPAPAIPTPGG